MNKKTNDILRWIVLGGIFLTPFVAFIVSSSLYFPFITGKNFAFRILIEIVFAAWAVLAFRDRAYAPKRTYLLYALAAFLGSLLVADVFGANFLRSFWSNYERMEGLITHLHLFAYFLVASTMLNAEKLWTWFFRTSLFASVCMTIYGFLQLAGVYGIDQGSTRLDGTLGNAIYLAIYLFFSIFIAILLMLREKNSLIKWAYGAIIAAESVVLYYTGTRGTLLAYIGALIVTFGLIAWQERKNLLLRKVSLGILASIVVVIGGFFAIRNTAFVRSSPVLVRFASISTSDSESRARLYIWTMAWDGFKQHPILGWGQENFNLVFNKNYDPQMYSQEQWFDRTHNVVLDWLIAGGLIGLAAYLSIFAAAIWLIWKSDDRFTFVDKSVLTGLLAGYFFHNLFVFDNLTSYLLFFGVLGYIQFGATPLPGKASPAAASAASGQAGILGNQQADLFVAPVAIVALIFVLYAANVKPILASVDIIQGLSRQSSLSVNLDDFKQAIAYGTFGTGEAREQLSQVATTVINYNVDNATKQAFVDEAVTQMQLQIKDVPGDARYEVFLGTLFNQIGQGKEAEKVLAAALADSPRKQTIVFELATSYLIQGDAKGALAIIKPAFDSAPQFDEARIIYATAAIYAGQPDLAGKLLSDRYGTADYGDNRVLQAYFTMKQFDHVIAIWKNRIAADPSNLTNYVSLGAAYASAGQKQNGIAAIEQGVKLEDAMTAETLKNPGISAADIAAARKANLDYHTNADNYLQLIRSGKAQ